MTKTYLCQVFFRGSWTHYGTYSASNISQAWEKFKKRYDDQVIEVLTPNIKNSMVRCVDKQYNRIYNLRATMQIVASESSSANSGV